MGSAATNAGVFDSEYRICFLVTRNNRGLTLHTGQTEWSRLSDGPNNLNCRLARDPLGVGNDYETVLP